MDHSGARMGAAHARARHWPRGVAEAAGCAGVRVSPPRSARLRPARRGIPTVTTTCPFMSLDMVGGHCGHMVSCTRTDYVFSMVFCNNSKLRQGVGNAEALANRT